MKKMKLELKKTLISSLSEDQKANIVGGDDSYDCLTTSFYQCTGYFCCSPYTTGGTCVRDTCGCQTYDPFCTRTC